MATTKASPDVVVTLDDPAALAAPALTEVTFPRRNTIAGLASYSIKSSTYEPRSAHYPESAGHVPTVP